MSVPGSITINVIVVFSMIILGGYAAGRAHQYRRRSLEMELAYNDGYNQASRTLFPVAVRSKVQETAAVVVLRASGRAKPQVAAPIVHSPHQHYRVSGSVQHTRAS